MTLPSFQQWLIAQCHRADGIGTLAKMSVSKASDVRKLGFEKWMKDIVDDKVFAYAVEYAENEFEVCLSELRSTGHSPSYPLWAMDESRKENSAKVWAKHRAHPEVSTEAYLHQCHKDLRQYLASRTLIYFDTCHWIRLREVHLNHPAKDIRYKPILNKLRQLMKSRKIICPFSFPLFIELTSQLSDETRRATADLMDEFAEGMPL
jgi:hypothetical protein